MSESARPSALATAAPGLDACVHCGFCLTACPTYLALEDENDSPRGRLVLMRGFVDGSLALDDPIARVHIDRCLGCRGCETACPSGVPYGRLLEATRETLVEARPLPLAARILLFVFARPRLLSIAMTFARVLRATRIPSLFGRLPLGRAGFALAMLASTERHGRSVVVRNATNGAGERAAVLLGCVGEGLLSPVNRATESVLGAHGYSIVPAPGQQCCGALHAHAGDADTARELARKNIAAFEASGADFIAMNSAGCGAMMKEYGHLLEGDAEWRDRAKALSSRVRDVSELLTFRDGPPHPRGKPLRVTYDAPCHLLHAQRVATEPSKLLSSIDGIELVPLPGSDQCCGSAGIFNIVQPDVSAAVLAPKLAAIASTGASVVVTGNPGCLMQIGAGLLRSGSAAVTRHPVELLAEAYERSGRPA